MQSSVSLANKYRPHLFQDVVGQNRAVKLLRAILARNAFKSAYILEGSHGNGKTTLARVFSNSILCESRTETQEPCLSCGSCRSFANKAHKDYLELDGGSISGVADMKILKEKIAAFTSRKIIVIDEAHTISTSGQLLLKQIAEDLADNIILILVTTDSAKIIPELSSRCFDLELVNISLEDIGKRLSYICEKEGFIFEPKALILLSQMSRNFMRDAIMLLDKISIFGSITENLVKEHFSLHIREDYIKVLINVPDNVVEALKILEVMLTKKSPRDISLGLAKAAIDAYSEAKGLKPVDPFNKVLAKTAFDLFGEELLVVAKFFGSPQFGLTREALLADVLLLEARNRIGNPLYTLLSSQPSLSTFVNSIRTKKSENNSLVDLARNPKRVRGNNNSNNTNNVNPVGSTEQLANLLGGRLIDE